jgi:carboxyl-terminal processing protease
MSPNEQTPPSADAAPETDARLTPATDSVPDAPPDPAPEPAPGPSPEGYVAAPVQVAIASRRLGPGRNTVLAAALVVVAILGGAALFVSGYSVGRNVGLTPGAGSNEEQDFKAFFDTYHAIVDRYPLEPKVDTNTLVEGAIKGMVDSLGDPYSSYLTPEDYKASLQSISGQFEGIGVEVGTVDSTGKTVECKTFGPDCRFSVVRPLEGSPAETAGIKAGDVITAVDGKALDGMTPDEARNLVRGPAGTSVSLTIVRGSQKPFDVSVTRAKIQEKQVVAKDLASGTVGYVQLTGFSEDAATEFVAAVKADVAKGDKKLIIDLRGNPGGYIDAAQKIASAFIASGPVFFEQYSNDSLQEWDALGGDAAVATDPSIKVILLVDGGSASASEIVTGALRDTKRATIVGAKTFGKGTVQQWITLDDQGAVKLTVAKWLTPDKDWIHKVGITPDVVVTVPDNTPAGQDPILDKALSILGASSASVEGWLVAA